MKNISFELDDRVFSDTEKILSETKTDRNRYINQALDHYNSLQKRKAIAGRLRQESVLVRDESLKVLTEFENLHDAD